MNKATILTMIGTAFIMSACSKAQFRTNRSQVLASSSVFGDNASGQIYQEGGGSNANGQINQGQNPLLGLPGAGAITNGQVPNFPNLNVPGLNLNIDINQIIEDSKYVQVENNRIRIVRTCSDAQTIRRNISPVITSITFLLSLTQDGVKVCQSSDSAKIRSMINAGTFDIPSLCGKSLSGKMILSILNEKGQELAGGKSVLYADNGSGLATDSSVYENCDNRSSPLFVDLRRDSTVGFQLTAPENGVLFDIQGLNAKPVPYTKKRISWFKDSSMAMLALPNARGQVHGINELFGDNTLGPDGKFAPHGFAALAKHDENMDGVIDAQDSVYRKLSLWIDHDLNGIAGPGELVSLSYMGIESLELEYDANYREIDRYGNEVRYKSVVNFTNGEAKLMYDLWFLIAD